MENHKIPAEGIIPVLFGYLREATPRIIKQRKTKGEAPFGLA